MVYGDFLWYTVTAYEGQSPREIRQYGNRVMATGSFSQGNTVTVNLWSRFEVQVHQAHVGVMRMRSREHMCKFANGVSFGARQFTPGAACRIGGGSR